LLILGLLLLIGGVNGRMPGWAAVAAIVLWPLSGFAATVALDFIEHGEASYFVVPAVLPPVIAGYALWARLPSWHQALPPVPISLIAGIAVALLSLAPAPRYALERIQAAAELRQLRAAEAAEAAQEAERRQKNLDRFHKLTADSPLWDWAPFFGKDSELDARAIAGARALTHRQTDAEAALRRDLGFPLLEYERLDLAATPAFCVAAGDFLRRDAASRHAPDNGTDYTDTTQPYTEAADIAVIEWLTGRCDIDDAVAAIREAVGSYRQSASRDAYLAVLAWRRGNGFFVRQDKARSLAEYDEALRLRPEGDQFHRSRGYLYVVMEQYDDAIADYDAAIRSNPGYSEAYYSRGNAYVAKGDDDKALASFGDAIRLDPEFAAAYNNRGLIYSREGRLDLALQDFDAAVKYAPKLRVALTNRGRIYFSQGTYAEAAADFAAALPLKPDDPYTVLLLYLARLHTGQNARETLTGDTAKLDRDAWPYPIAAAWLGEADEKTVLATAASDKGQACEADFYFGDKSAAEGDAATARPLLERALSGCPADYLEATLAKYELARLPN
jgi:lipoprotein NlpI